MNKIILSHIALLTLNLIYATNHLLAKGVTPEYLGPDGFIFFRVSITSLIFLMIYLLFYREKVERKDLFKLFYTGMLGCGLSQLLFFNGLARTSAINTGVLMTSIPIFTVILSFFILKEKITKYRALGIIIGAIGAIALTTLGKAPAFDSGTGDLLIIANAFVFAAYLVMVKPLMKKYHPVTVATFNFLSGLGFVILYPKLWADLGRADFGAFDQRVWMVIGFVVIFATFITYLLNIFSLKYLSPSVTGSYVYTQPALVVLLTYIFTFIGWTDDVTGSINGAKLLFMTMIFTGVYLVSRPATDGLSTTFSAKKQKD